METLEVQQWTVTEAGMAGEEGNLGKVTNDCHNVKKQKKGKKYK